MAIANNSPIPKKATVPAGKKDSEKFSIRAVDTKIYFRDIDLTPYNVVSNSLKREILSTDLEEGMTIKAAVTSKNRIKATENMEK